MKTIQAILILSFVFVLAGCGAGSDADEFGQNPFLDTSTFGKEDSGYINARGVELHVTLEADIGADAGRLFAAPPDLALFAVSYLRNAASMGDDPVYLEILAEDAIAPEQLDWLVEGQWLSTDQARNVDQAKLKHFRMKQVSAVVLGDAASRITAGIVYKAVVPVRPYSLMTEAGDSCATPDSHISLDSSIYWYLWNPDLRGCRAETQTMTVTVNEVLANNPPSYPEYNKLWEDGKFEVVVLFGRAEETEDIRQDLNWKTADQFGKWLQDAGFVEEPNAPLGKRFVKKVGQLQEIVDVYYPDVFENVADRANMRNWQRAVSEHEAIFYNGHSVLGTGYAFEQVNYPDFYQIFQIGSCLSYEYYVRPVLAGKGSWAKVDVLSNVEPTYFHENLSLSGALLAGLFKGLENGGRYSWQDIMADINRKLGHTRFGVSGARGNCFSPNGDLCGSSPEPKPTAEKRYENNTAVDILDNEPNGIKSIIEVPDHLTIGTLEVELNVQHTYVGDLQIVLSHGSDLYALWKNDGGSTQDIHQKFTVDLFKGKNASGEWKLQVIDQAAGDSGTLQSWALIVRASN
jgi:hypothetical protein